ncbi:hypothetical protein [Plantactinospora mayteni]|nr:hypothetical protein [Plantactinospora mayteni]
MLTRLFGTVLVFGLVVVLGWPAPAAAHGGADTDDVRLAQTIGSVELTVVIRYARQVPGPLYVDVIAHQPVRDLAVGLAVGPGTGQRASTGTVHLVQARAGTYPSTLRVTQTGAHELELRAGAERSILPFRVLRPRVAPWVLAGHVAFGVAALLLVGALFTAAASRRLPATALGGGAVVALVVAFTVAVMSAQLPPVPPDGAAAAVRAAGTVPAGRPYVEPVVGTDPAVPRAGEEFTLRLDLFDGATGRPVDDLVPHHAALGHLVVTSQDGGFFRHAHPLRTAAGRLAVGLRVDRPGRYLAAVEVERLDSGAQLLTGEFTVAGEARAGTAVPEAGVVVTTSPQRPVVGRPTLVEVDTGHADLQSWLGMAGHLIVRNQRGDFLGHVHESGSMAMAMAMSGTGQAPDDTVGGYGPRLRFTFSFPAPGRYLAWTQYVRNFEIVTVPFVVDVVPGPGAA